MDECVLARDLLTDRVTLRNEQPTSTRFNWTPIIVVVVVTLIVLLLGRWKGER